MDLENKVVESYFNHLKEKGVISSGWKYVSFEKKGEKIKIIYSHKTQKGDPWLLMDIQYKTSTYVVDSSLVIWGLREHKLNDLFR